MIDEFVQDIRLLFRHLARRPGFGVIVLVTLALGIGVTTGVFSVVRGVLLRPLPYPAPKRLVYFDGGGVGSLHNFEDLRARLETVEDMSASMAAELTLTGEGEPTVLSSRIVSADFFPMLGVAPAAGRLLGPADDGTARILLGHAFWLDRFGGDTAVVGRILTLNGSSLEVVGVAPSSLEALFDAQLVIPFPWDPDAGIRLDRTWRAFSVYGRLAEGRTLEDARAEVDVAWARLRQDYPDENAKWEVEPVPLRDWLTRGEEMPLAILFSASVLFLLVACANVASLFLSRLETRGREFAVRSALGAKRSRLMRLVCSEALVLGVLGGAVGIGLAVVLLDTSLTVFGGFLTRPDAVRVDDTVLLFSLGLSMAAGLIVGGVTIISWRGDRPILAIGRTARAGGGRTTRLRRLLVWSEVAMSLMVVTALALLVQSFMAVRSVDMGMESEDVLVVRLGNLTAASYPDAASGVMFTSHLMERLGSLPGVERVAFASHAPLRGCCANGLWARADNPEINHRFVEFRVVTPSYFQVLGVPLKAGRVLAASDRPGNTPVVVVNETLARALWPGASAVGEWIRRGDQGERYQVVGVVGDTREYSPERDAPPVVYLPMEQMQWPLSVAVTRVALPPDVMAPAIRGAVHDMDPLVPVISIRSLAGVVSDMTADRRATTYLMGLMGTLAFLLGGIGVYGVVNHMVLGRIREVGVRLALGAARGSVLRLVLRQGLLLVIPGVVVGTLGAVAAHGLLKSLLFGVGPFDPRAYCAAVTVFVVAALAATLGPAAGAARVDPARTLREGD